MRARKSGSRRRRIGTVLAVLAGALIVLVLAAPLLAEPFVRRALLERIELATGGTATLDELDLDLSGDLELTGLVVRTTDDRPLASLALLHAQIAVFPALAGRYRVLVRAEDVELHLHRDASGNWEIPGTGGEAPPREPREPGALPDLRADVALSGGRVVVHGEDGETVLHGIAFQARLAEPDRPAPFQLRLEASGPEGPAGSLDLEGSIALSSLERATPSLAALRGEVHLRVHDLTLAGFEPLLAAGTPLAGATGRLAGEADLALEPGLALQGTLDLALRELRLAGPRAGAEPARLDEVTLRGEASLDPSGASRHEVALRAARFLALAWAGRSTPAAGAEPPRVEGTLTLDGSVGELADALRPWTPLRADLHLGGKLAGRAELAASVSERPESVRVSATLGLSELAARDDAGNAVALGSLRAADLALDLEADLATGRVEVERLHAEAGHVRASGHLAARGLPLGAAPDGGREPLAIEAAALDIVADLGALHRSLARILDLGDAPLGGRITARIEGSGDADGSRLEATLGAQGLQLATGGPNSRSLALARLDARMSATYEPAADRLAISTAKLESDVFGLEGRGEVVGIAGSAPRRAELGAQTRLDLAALERSLGGQLDGATLGGSPIEGELALTLDEASQVLRLEQRADELRLAREGSPEAVHREVRLHAEIRRGVASGQIAVQGLEIASSAGELSLAGELLDLATPRAASADLRLRARAELEPLMAALGVDRDGRATRGALTADWRLDGERGDWLLTGTTQVRELELVLPRAPGAANGAPAGAPFTLRDPEVALEARARVAVEPLDVELDRLTLSSTIVRGAANGAVRNLRALFPAGEGAPDAEVRFDALQGTIAYVPDRVGAVLGPWLPGELRGSEEKEIRFRYEGSVGALAPLALLREGEGRAEIAIGRYEAQGLDTAGKLELVAADGRARIAGDLEANGGTLTLAGDVALEPAAEGAPPARSTLRFDLEAARASSKLAPLLALAHPAFAQLGAVKGGEIGGLLTLVIDLAYDGALTPELFEGGWSAFPKQGIQGSGRLELADASLRGSPFLDQVLARLGLDASKSLSLEPITFEVRDGRLFYGQPWSWTIDGTPTSFSGSIGLDGTLDLAWSVPVSERLVQKLDFLEVLAGRTIEVPIGGTVTSPRLKLDDVLAGLAREAAEGELRRRLGLGGGGGQTGDDPAALLSRADELWGKGDKVEAAKLYKRLRDDFKLSLVYLLNQDRIKKRSKPPE